MMFHHLVDVLLLYVECQGFFQAHLLCLKIETLSVYLCRFRIYYFLVILKIELYTSKSTNPKIQLSLT